MSISMTAEKTFTNPRIASKRPNGAVVPGDTFTTDWLHAKELVRLGLAKADDPKALEQEPSEALDPHNQVSAPELAETNARRAKARGETAPKAPGAVTEAGIVKPAAAPAAPAAARA